MTNPHNNLNPDALQHAAREFAASASELRIRVERRLPAIDADESEPFATLHEYSDLPTEAATEIIARTISSYLERAERPVH